MDPVSAVFSSLIALLSSGIEAPIKEISGADEQALIIRHEGMEIPFRYRFWKIREQSVCESYQQNFVQYAKCTQAARSMFREACEYLRENPGSTPQYPKMKNMYCVAAVSYQPTTANVEWAPATSPLEDARAACNLAIADLMTDRSDAALMRKKRLCEKYQAMEQAQD